MVGFPKMLAASALTLTTMITIGGAVPVVHSDITVSVLLSGCTAWHTDTYGEGASHHPQSPRRLHSDSGARLPDCGDIR